MQGPRRRRKARPGCTGLTLCNRRRWSTGSPSIGEVMGGRSLSSRTRTPRRRVRWRRDHWPTSASAPGLRSLASTHPDTANPQDRRRRVSRRWSSARVKSSMTFRRRPRPRPGPQHVGTVRLRVRCPQARTGLEAGAHRNSSGGWLVDRSVPRYAVQLASVESGLLADAVVGAGAGCRARQPGHA